MCLPFIEEIDSENTLYCISLNISSGSSNPEVTQSDIWESYSTLEILILKFSDYIQTIVVIVPSSITEQNEFSVNTSE